MGGPGLTLVTVFYEAEIALQHLQARSLRRHATDLVSTIVVIDNTRRGLSREQGTALLAAYGPVSARVRLLRPDAIGRVPRTTGWRSQQVLKLLVAGQVDTAQYLVLDAKNHLVGPLTEDFVRAPDGRARVTAYGFRSHPLRPSLEKVLGYFALEPQDHLDRFTATVTPFVLDTDLVRSLVTDVERSSGRAFAQEFVARGLTEFFLYTAWILAGGRRLEEVFDIQEQSCPVVWPRGATDAGVAAAIAQAERDGLPVFSVHRRALGTLDPAAAGRLAVFWSGCGLFDDPARAMRFIEQFQRGYRRHELAQRWRDLPAKVATRALGRFR